MARWLYFPAAGTPPPPTVSLGGGVTVTSSSNAVATTFVGAITPTTGDVLVRIVYLDNGTNVLPLTVTLGGSAVTRRAGYDPEHGGASRGVAVWIGTVRGLGTSSAKDLVVTTSGTVGIGKIVARLTQIRDWGGLVGGAAANGVDGTNATSASSGTVTIVGSSSILVGAGGPADANCDPLAAAGWTIGDDVTLGSVAGASVAAVFTFKDAPNAGGTASHVVTSATSWTQWCSAILELR